ncbi:MAG: GNAT family N-acetyltransferase [Oscillospiraceae bacterium]|nr:GNAT family N-acetyltransferase [Oscillospiraceae bacterium]
MITINQAMETDIPIIEDILLDVFNWLESTGKHMWVHERIKWDFLSTFLKIEEFYIAYIHNEPIGCMALIDFDPLIWQDINKGESLFIHRLAVKRNHAGQGVSKVLIDYAKMQSIQRGINAVRLDCWQDREKLRAIYEREGFVCVEEKVLFNHYHTALYRWKI